MCNQSVCLYVYRYARNMIKNTMGTTSGTHWNKMDTTVNSNIKRLNPIKAKHPVFALFASSFF